eukprot:scaffold101719_cov30-Phaeocystis_antarctica.AAC.1
MACAIIPGMPPAICCCGIPMPPICCCWGMPMACPMACPTMACPTMACPMACPGPMGVGTMCPPIARALPLGRSGGGRGGGGVGGVSVACAARVRPSRGVLVPALARADVGGLDGHQGA